MEPAAMPDEYAVAIRELEALRRMLLTSRESGVPLEREVAEKIRLRVLEMLTTRLATLTIDHARHGGEPP